MYLTITIDTENPYKDTPMEDWIYCNFNGECFGIERIMDILDRQSVKGTFFVDVYERYNSRDERVASVCKLIDERGHDVELHTHPLKNRLCDMPFEEQKKIIADGVEFLLKTLNKRPAAHRAGSYMANLDTLKALKENGILIDSSNFFEVSPLGITKNRAICYYGVLEIPVTYFHVPLKPVIKLIGKTVGRKIFYNGNCKYDINWCSASGLKGMIHKFRKADIRIVNLFLHSFSFIEEKKYLPPPIPHLQRGGQVGGGRFINRHDLKKFEDIIAYLKSLGWINFITMREIALKYRNDGDFKEYIVGGGNDVPVSLLGVDLRALLKFILPLTHPHPNPLPEGEGERGKGRGNIR